MQNNSPYWEKKNYLLIVSSEASGFTISATNTTIGSMNNSFGGFASPPWLFPPLLLSDGVADNHRTRERKRKLVATFAFLCFGIRNLYILISGLTCETQVGMQCIPPSPSHKTLSFCVYLTNNFCILWNNAMLPVIKSKSLRQSFKCNLEVIGTHQNVKIFFSHS